MFKYKKIKKETIILFVILFFALIIRLNFWLHFGDFTWDEGSHSLSGILIAKTIINGFDYNYFRNFTDHYWASTGSLFFFPWGYTILTTISYLIFGFSELTARLPSMLFSLISIPVIYILGKKLFDKNIGLLSAYLMAINPYFITRGGVAIVDVPMTCLIMAGLYFYLLGLDSSKIKPWLMSGLFLGLAGLMKPTGFIVFPFLILLTIYNKNYKYLFKKQFIVFIITGVIVFLSYFGFGVLAFFVLPKFGLITSSEGLAVFKNIFQWFGRILPEKYFNLFGEKLIYANYGDPNWTTFNGWYYYLLLIPKQLGSLSIFLTSIIGTIYLSTIKNKKKSFYLTIFFILYIYLIFTAIANKDPRYTMPLIPFMIILSAVGINYLYNSFTSKNLQIIIATLLLSALTYLSINSIINSNFNAIGNNLESSIESIMALKPGLVVPLHENNIVNTQTISFYLAIHDNNLNYSVKWPDDISIADYVVVQKESDVLGFSVVLIKNRFHLLPKNLIFSDYK